MYHHQLLERSLAWLLLRSADIKSRFIHFAPCNTIFNTQKRNLLCLLHTYKMNAFTFECLETHRNEPLRSIFEIKKQMFQGFFSLFGRIQRHPSDILTKNPDNNSEKLCAISPLQYVSTSSMLHFQVC